MSTHFSHTYIIMIITLYKTAYSYYIVPNTDIKIYMLCSAQMWIESIVHVRTWVHTEQSIVQYEDLVLFNNYALSTKLLIYKLVLYLGWKLEVKISYLVYGQGVKVFDVSEPGETQTNSAQQLNPLQHTITCFTPCKLVTAHTQN
jgi:hypothetical protein